MSRFVHTGNVATTPISEPVLRAMMPYLTESYGNPSSLYSKKCETKRALELAREGIAEHIGARPGELYSTTGGSELDNRTIKGIIHELALQDERYLTTTRFEHHTVLHTVGVLECEGFSATYPDVHKNGLARPEEVAATIRPDTAFVSVMYANNEVDTVQSIAQIGAVCREYDVLFRTDAVQAVEILPINVAKQNIGLLSLSGHKLHAPKDVGVLYVRQGILIQDPIDSSAQERKRRAGVENLASIVGLTTALREACVLMEECVEHLRTLRGCLIDSALKTPGSSLDSDREHRLPGSVSLCFEGVNGEMMLLPLDRQGTCAFSGSVCIAGSLDANHVLLALGTPVQLAKGSLCLTLGKQNTREDAERTLSILSMVVERLRVG